MKPTRESGPRNWVIAAVGAMVAVALVLALFRAPPGAAPLPQPTGPNPGTAPVSFARLGDKAADPRLKEEATLRDPTPLFLPTQWNASESSFATNPRREFTGSFQGYAPIMTFPETELKLALLPVTPVPARPADAFAAEKPSRPYTGLGQTDRPVVSLEPRGAFIEVVAAGTGGPILAQPRPDARPPGDSSWQPLEFLVAVDRKGIVGPPVLTASSGTAAVDGYFANYLVDILRIGERVRPGFYRISIGP